MKKDARKPSMTCGCNHKKANLATLRDCEEEKEVEKEERIRERTSSRLHAGDIDHRNQIQHLNSRALLHTPEQGTNSTMKSRLRSGNNVGIIDNELNRVVSPAILKLNPRNGSVVAQVPDKKWVDVIYIEPTSRRMAEWGISQPSLSAGCQRRKEAKKLADS
jgi:hypothetical protein